MLNKLKNALNPKKSKPASSLSTSQQQVTSPTTPTTPTAQVASPPPQTAQSSSCPSPITQTAVGQVPSMPSVDSKPRAIKSQQEQKQEQLHGTTSQRTQKKDYASLNAEVLKRDVHENVAFGIHVFGPPLPPAIQFRHYNHKLKIGEVLDMGRGGDCTVISSIPFSDRSYLIQNTKGSVKFIKIESLGLDNVQEPSLNREAKLLVQFSDEDHRLKQPFSGNFLNLFFAGKMNGYFYIVTTAAEINLRDLKNRCGRTFSPASFVHIASQTLQCIHNVMVYNHMHRAVSPKNFVLGVGSNNKTIYIVNFSIAHRISTDERKDRRIQSCPKFENINLVFAPRSIHLGAKYSFIDDVESWIYCFIWLYDNTLYPISTASVSERGLFNYKKRLFYGGYDEELGPIRKYVNLFLKEVEKSNKSVVDYPFFASVIEQMAADWKVTGNEKLDWEVEPNINNNNNTLLGQQQQRARVFSPSKKRESKPPTPDNFEMDNLDNNVDVDNDNLISFRSKRETAAAANVERTQTPTQEDDKQQQQSKKRGSKNRRKSITLRNTTRSKEAGGGGSNITRRKNGTVDATQADDELFPVATNQQKKLAKSLPREKGEKKSAGKTVQEEEEESRGSSAKNLKEMKKKTTVEEETAANSTQDQEYSKL